MRQQKRTNAASARTASRKKHADENDAREVLADGLVMARALAFSQDDAARLSTARALTYATVAAYWSSSRSGIWDLYELPSEIASLPLPESGAALARSMGQAASALDVNEASYLIGVLYTAMMPDASRSRFGAYYTPPALCERLLDMASEARVDWRTAHVLDPACGGGAFLSPVARRMVNALEGCSAKIALKNITQRLSGFEIDPFAAWMSHVFLEVTLGDLCLKAGTRLKSIVRTCDTLQQEPDAKAFDLVVGNPPYGRLTLSLEQRERFRRGLYGHANLYGVFTDLALRFTRPGGVIAYVTPTSFLAGEYFKALRGLLGREAPPASIDFVEGRKGVFADVLQETLLAAYHRGGDPQTGKVHFLSSTNGTFKATTAGSFRLPEEPDQPWLMPRTKSDCKLVRSVATLPSRLSDFGYTVSTGPLVWNRHKNSLRDRTARGRYPLIWAESVRSDGIFEFRSEKKNHKPYFEPKPKEQWVVTNFPCVLLQRTTAKEQARRLIAAELPASFLKEHGAVVVENHLNMIRPTGPKPEVSPAAVAALLNSRVVDRIFRCINGSVAVSAYELEALPLPSKQAMKRIETLVKRKARRETIEVAVAALYEKGKG